MDFDYVIIGAGSAGCVLANRLSADPSVRVCLVEAGPVDRSPLIHTPAGIIGILPTRHVNWAFETVPQPGRRALSATSRAARRLAAAAPSTR